MTTPDCKFYIKGGRCAHQGAPTPGKSWCIGKEACGVYEQDKAKAEKGEA